MSGGGELSQSSNADEDKVVAEGLGYLQPDAVADAYKAAVKVVVEKKLAKSPAERHSFDVASGKYYAQAKGYTRGGRILSQRTDEEGKFQVRVEMTFDVGRLRADLEADGVLKPVSETVAEVTNPSVCVMPDADLKGYPLGSALVGEAQSYFTSQGYNVEEYNADRSLGNEKLAKMTNEIRRMEGMPQDDTFQIAQQIGCDVYVVVHATVTAGRSGADVTNQATATVKIYETTTGSVKGTGNGRTGERVSTNAAVVAGDAVRDAVREAQRQLLAYWTGESKKGHQFRLTVAGAFSPDARRGLVELVRSVAREYKVITATAQTLDTQVWTTQYTQAVDLLDALQQGASKRGLGTLDGPVTRKMLILRLEP